MPGPVLKRMGAQAVGAAACGVVACGVVASGVVVSGIMGGCATPRDDVRWETATTKADAPATAPRPAVATDYDAAAGGYFTAAACETGAREVYGADKDKGWALLQGCLRRPDFVDLFSLQGPPWNARLRAQSDLYPRVLDVIARRGADDPAKDLRELGLPIQDWNVVKDDPPHFVQKLFTVRGKIERVYEQAGRTYVFVEETRLEAGETDSPYSYYRYYRSSPLQNKVKPTGSWVLLVVDSAAKRAGLKEAKEFLFLARLSAEEVRAPGVHGKDGIVGPVSSMVAAAPL